MEKAAEGTVNTAAEEMYPEGIYVMAVGTVDEVVMVEGKERMTVEKIAEDTLGEVAKI